MLSVPTILLAWPALAHPGTATAPALWAGIVTGLLVLVGGVILGGWAFERRGAQLMEFVETV